jgi:hypothetical protein
MKKASLVVSRPYQENRIFQVHDKSLNRDNCLAPFIQLKKEFREQGYDLSTSDLNSIEDSDLVLYNDMPKELPLKGHREKSYLLILESPLIVKNSWSPDRLEAFKKIFSWNDDITDDIKFYKVNYSFELPQEISIDETRSKLCCLISANKRSQEVNELYTERIISIKWFEKNAPQDFDLFGIGWDMPPKTHFFSKVMHFLLKKLQFLRFLYRGATYPSYKGMVDSKVEVLAGYDFSICYENIKDLNGYITEKIFDSFFAGCIPIYWGAKNIKDYIPEHCFIDRRDFSSMNDLYDFLSRLSGEEKKKYRENISNFLKGESVKAFDASHFAKTITKEMLSE